MKFKLAFASMLSLIAVSNNVLASNEETLNLNVTITDASCIVPFSELNRTIELDEPLVTTVIEAAPANGVVSSKDFAFNVTDCPADVNSVGIKFDFTADPDHAAYMSNTGQGRGVRLGITDGSDTLVASGSVIDGTVIDPDARSATVNAKVKAFRVGSETPVEGDLNSTATVTVITN